MATVKASSVRAICLTLKQRFMSASLGRACVRVCVYARVAASDMPCCSDAGVVFTDALMCAHEVSDPVPLVIVNGRAPDFRSEGSEFESPCPHVMSGCVRALLLANGNERVNMLISHTPTRGTERRDPPQITILKFKNARFMFYDGFSSRAAV